MAQRARKKAAVVLATSAALTLLGPVATASAAAKPVNLIKDPGGELSNPDQTGDQVPVKFWTPLKGTGFTTGRYNSPGFDEPFLPHAPHPGKAFFAGGPDSHLSGATQLVPLTSALVAKGQAAFVASGYFGGFSDQHDYMSLTITWETAKGKAISKVVLGPVTEEQRKGITSVYLKSKTGVVPKNATQALLLLHSVRTDGLYNDGYADNLSLTLSKKK
ncbi:hypothetical protein acdb102_29510 [Acidothermaceae bacterium B102]|nr:hypothetical protein acdb102_29510 [Acidothermaceae bacterium B102]